MKRNVTVGLVTIGVCLALTAARAQPPRLDPAAPANEQACVAVAALALPELAGMEVEWIPAGSVRPAAGAAVPPEPGGEALRVDLPAHCRVRGVVEPAIRFEVWLPAAAAWNGRFLAVGGSGFAGNLSYDRMGTALAAGYATASTDTGHRDGDFSWLADDSRLRDFGYRAVYEMTAKAEAVIARFYARPADYRYFNGCSLGGRQGLMQAQRFPDDYDGIVAGAPVNAFVATRTTQLWAARAARPAATAPALLGPDVLEGVNDAVLAQCDALDGVRDGVLEDPRRCNFDPASLQCGAGPAGACLTAAQVGALHDIYTGPAAFVPGTSESEPLRIAMPGFAVGSEAEWRFAAGEGLSPLTLEFFRRAVFADELADWRDFDLAADYPRALDAAGWILDATSPDLAAYRDRGGKLILYHGWNDANNSPAATIAYYESVEATLAQGANPLGIETDAFARLFMVPGMAHCGGGTGTDEFDAQRAIEDWVERGIAPDRIEAARTEAGQLVRTRPLCPYPLVARYGGSGNSDRSGSFQCAF